MLVFSLAVLRMLWGLEFSIPAAAILPQKYRLEKFIEHLVHSSSALLELFRTLCAPQH